MRIQPASTQLSNLAQPVVKKREARKPEPETQPQTPVPEAALLTQEAANQVARETRELIATNNQAAASSHVIDRDKLLNLLA